MPAYAPYHDDEKAATASATLTRAPLQLYDYEAAEAAAIRSQRRTRSVKRTFLFAFAIAAAFVVFMRTANYESNGEHTSILHTLLGPLSSLHPAAGRNQHVSKPNTRLHRTAERISTFHSCPLPDSSLFSCHLPLSAPVDTCCVNAPGGQLLLAQFWDFAPGVGPEDKWTLHGLWPDHCDGSFDQFCNTTRSVSSVEAIFASAGADELVAAMHEEWKDYQNRDDSLWTHEWNKHGTCISTLAPECYGPEDDTESAPMIEYFSRAMDLHGTLDTFTALGAAGIVPSWDAVYTRNEIMAAIATNVADGKNVTLGCTRDHVLNEVWYHFNVKGRAQDGDFIFADPDSDNKGSCPLTGIKYLPKVYRAPKTPAPAPSLPIDPTEPFQGKGYVTIDDGSHGCLISGGVWYASGTCATIRGTPSRFGGIELSSSRGPCAVTQRGRLVCAPGLAPSQFTVSAAGELEYGGQSSWGAYSRPFAWAKEGLWTGSALEELDLPVRVALKWRSL
ncbi:ribonuclease T2-like protein [Limtongia smithiae]|uniref:ribonuclease T2-like protein n=1 Tax=Limtongia smithiae TaxID=1125753 RepID=UPI0034CDF9B0